MKKRMVYLAGCGCLLSGLMIGCASPRDAAVAGAWLGRQIGTPLGMTATAIDETFAYADDIMNANPRYDRSSCCPIPSRPSPECSGGSQGSYRVRADVLIETDAPVAIRSVSLEDPKAAKDFWAVR